MPPAAASVCMWPPRGNKVLDNRDHVLAPAVAHLHVVDTLGELSILRRLHEVELREAGVQAKHSEVDGVQVRRGVDEASLTVFRGRHARGPIAVDGELER